MRSLGTNAGHGRHRASGFSLLEMIIVLAIVMILAGITSMSLMPALQQQHVTNAYNTTLGAMRQARDNAVAQQTSYRVTFSNTAIPNTVTVAPTLVFNGAQNTVTYQLPPDVSFTAEPGIPTAPANVPDNYGVGAVAIDFGYTAGGAGNGAGGGKVIFFCPDGSAQTTSACAGAGNWSGGVVYISRTGNLMTSRALTLWGATGRIHGWRLYNTAGVQWQRQ